MATWAAAAWPDHQACEGARHEHTIFTHVTCSAKFSHEERANSESIVSFSVPRF
jgi:hypothetical protein